MAHHYHGGRRSSSGVLGRRGPAPGSEEDEETVYITPLGAAKEVGRSCVILKHRGRTVMLDCGIHPGRTGDDALPFFDSGPDASEIDLILISHFHLDHAASLPYFTEKVQGGAFKGRIFATHPTKAIMRLMLQNHIRTDSLRVNERGEEEAEPPLYTEADLQACLDKIEVIDFQQRMEHKGIKFWCYNAGHVLGAAMFMVEIAGVRLLYTGDYSMEDDRHLMAAEVPYQYRPDILLVESTYGVQNHPPQEERERRFTDEVAKIVRRGGRCLLPVFALGRAQELMLILDEYWHAHKDLHKVPIYFASYTSEKAHRVYETYVNMMNAHVRQQMDLQNPFRFNFIRTCRAVRDLDDFQPAVVLASPGFLNSGPSRQLFDRWCTSEVNGVVMTGYTQEGTLARKLLTHPEVVEDMRGQQQPLKCSIESISFSAHVDYRQNEDFMRRVRAPIVVLVHGEQNQMNELKRALVRTIGSTSTAAGGYGANILTPDLCTDVQLTIPQRKHARVLGSLAEAPLQPGQALSAVLVQSRSDFSTRLLAPEDLAAHTQLRRGGIHQRVHFPFHQTRATLLAFLGELFDDVQLREGEGVSFPPPQPLPGRARAKAAPQEEPSAKVAALVISQCVTLFLDEGKGKALMEWETGPVADMVADAALALAMEAQSSPSALRMTSTPCCAHRKLQQRAADAGAAAGAPPSPAAAAASTAAAEEEDGVKEVEGGEAHSQPPAAGTGLAGKARLLHRILSSIYGSESASLDLAIFQTTVSLPGGVVGRVRLEHGGLVDVTSEDPNLEMQLRGVVRQVGSVLYAKADVTGPAEGEGEEEGGEQDVGIRLKPRGAEYGGQEEYGGEEGYGEEYGEEEEEGDFGAEECAPEAAEGGEGTKKKNPPAAAEVEAAPAPPLPAQE